MKNLYDLDDLLEKVNDEQEKKEKVNLPKGEIDLDFAKEMVEIHNEYRKKHGVDPLTLNEELCVLAQEWAEVLAKKNKMYHRPNPVYGENIYYMFSTIPGHEASARDAVSGWYSEMKKYHFGRTATQKGCGHFTQLIWKTTKEVGSGYATSKDGTKYIVANYNPPGNWKNKYAENVPPPLNFTTRK